MKTPAEWLKTPPPKGDEARPFGVLTHDDIAEIQRDAREGMVPVEDVAPLLWELQDRFATQALPPEFIALRAKHPNLFTK